MQAYGGSFIRALSGAADGPSDSLVRAAAADIEFEGVVDLFIAGVGVGGEEARGGHDHAALAVAALRDFFLDPGFLERMVGQALDRDDLAARSGSGGCHARLDGNAIDVDGANAALGDSATELGAGEIEHVTDDPKQGHIRIGKVDGLLLAV